MCPFYRGKIITLYALNPESNPKSHVSINYHHQALLSDGANDIKARKVLSTHAQIKFTGILL